MPGYDAIKSENLKLIAKDIAEPITAILTQAVETENKIIKSLNSYPRFLKVDLEKFKFDSFIRKYNILSNGNKSIIRQHD